MYVDVVVAEPTRFPPGRRLEMAVGLGQRRVNVVGAAKRGQRLAAFPVIRTVAGRLGHGGGGTTTLRVYSAWIAEADQRASASLAARMPELPGAASNAHRPLAISTGSADTRDLTSDPYHLIASDLRAAIRCGALGPGDHLPTVKVLAARYSVSEGTAHRAIAILSASGEIMSSRGRKAVVTARATTPGDIADHR